jgi:N-acetylmuramoyl-L-alanine amidase
LREGIQAARANIKNEARPETTFWRPALDQIEGSEFSFENSDLRFFSARSNPALCQAESYAMRTILLLAILFPCSLAAAQTVCLDPGHPSENGAGSRGKRLTEVEVAWRVAKRLEELLLADGYQVVLTKRTQNEKVVNRRRAEIANSSQADLLLRLHCDAAAGSGFGVYYPAHSGRAHRVTGPSAAVRQASAALARKFHPAVAQALQGVHKDRGFSKVPVLLVELAVLTNPRDEAFLASKKGFEALCQALRKGVYAAVPRDRMRAHGLLHARCDRVLPGARAQ